MNKNQEIRAFLERYRPASGEANSLIVRAGNALLRYHIYTLEEMAGLSDDKIARMRNVGDKTKVFIRQAIEDYRRERGCVESTS